MSDKEYDPFMHSAEHILNGAMVKKFNRGRSFSQHIERKKSKCDYHFDRNLTNEELLDLENTVNSVITSDLEVCEYFLTHEEADKKFNLSKLPESFGDTVRIVKIGDFDECPCIGPHVKRTSEIGEIKIISSSCEEEVLRIRFKRVKS